MKPQDEVSRYRALLDVSIQLSRAMDLEALLNDILTCSQEVMSAEACSLFLPDSRTGELVIHSALGDKAPMLDATRIPKGAGVAGAVFQSGKSINIQDPKNDPRHYGKVDEKTGFVTRAMITSPLLNGDECLGVIQVLNPVDRDFFDDHDEQIVLGFASLIATALVRLENQKHAVADARAKQELELAKEIQLSFLPPSPRIFSTCQTRMAYFPAREVGGDFYFVHALDDDRTLLGLGDVTGKGIPAALTMARATAEIQGAAPRLKDNLGEWVSQINDLLSVELKHGRFIGITFMVANAKSSTLQVCTAGQYPPACANNSKWEMVECTKQVPLGILPGYQYQSETFPLKPNQQWLLFSDGVTEARNEQNEEYTEDKFLAELPLNKTGANTFSAAIEAWQKFVGSAPAHDDSSIFLFDWRGEMPSSRFSMPCDTSKLCTARDFVERWADYAGFDNITVGQIVLACDEATTNIYRYAYDENPGKIDFEVKIAKEHLIITLKDEGKPVDLEKIKGRSLDDLRPGGLGTILLQSVFDDVTYEPQKVGTLLTLQKKI